jgi:hypothetical protein
MPLRFRPARSRDFRSAARPRVAFANCRTNEIGAAHPKSMVTSFRVQRFETSTPRPHFRERFMSRDYVNKLFEIFSSFGLQHLQRSSNILILS